MIFLAPPLPMMGNYHVRFGERWDLLFKWHLNKSQLKIVFFFLFSFFFVCGGGGGSRNILIHKRQWFKSRMFTCLIYNLGPLIPYIRISFCRFNWQMTCFRWETKQSSSLAICHSCTAYWESPLLFNIRHLMLLGRRTIFHLLEI